MMADKNLTILVIVDQRELMESMVRTLETEGYKSSGVTNSQIALNRIRETVPDLIICDILIPHVDGISIVRQMRNGSDSRLSKIPFIFLADRDPMRDVINDLEVGIDDYVIKPFTIAELLERIKGTLGRRNIELP